MNISLLLQDIADSAYKFRKGQPQLFVSFSVLIADMLFSILVQTLFLIQSMAVNVLPFNYFGIITNIHLCLLYSLYSFEYKWCNMGWELHKRLTYIEINWPYFLGFGTIMTFFTQLTSSITIRFVSSMWWFLFFSFSFHFNSNSLLSFLVVVFSPCFSHSVYWAPTKPHQSQMQCKCL